MKRNLSIADNVWNVSSINVGTTLREFMVLPSGIIDCDHDLVKNDSQNNLNWVLGNVQKGGTVLCGYVGLNYKHPFYGISYTDFENHCHDKNIDTSNLIVHCGFTYSNFGDNDYRSAGKGKNPIYWFGWDYGHCNDYNPISALNSNAKKWTIKEVFDQTFKVAYWFLNHSISTYSKKVNKFRMLRIDHEL